MGSGSFNYLYIFLHGLTFHNVNHWIFVSSYRSFFILIQLHVREILQGSSQYKNRVNVATVVVSPLLHRLLLICLQNGWYCTISDIEKQLVNTPYAQKVYPDCLWGKLCLRVGEIIKTFVSLLCDWSTHINSLITLFNHVIKIPINSKDYFSLQENVFNVTVYGTQKLRKTIISWICSKV
jgi:hypothetical protein